MNGIKDDEFECFMLHRTLTNNMMKCFKVVCYFETKYLTQNDMFYYL